MTPSTGRVAAGNATSDRPRPPPGPVGAATEMFTSKNQILKAIYKRLTNNFSGGRSEISTSSVATKAFMHPSPARKRVCARYSHQGAPVWRFPFHTGQHMIIKPCCEREAGHEVAVATLRCVGRWRLELIGNVIISREGLAAVLHLREQLQGLLFFLGGVVAQQVGSGGEDRRSASPGH